jgi:hypothetical protein
VLAAQATGIGGQGGLGGRVGRHHDGGDGGQQRSREDERGGRRLLGEQVRQELDREVHQPREVDVHLLVERGQVDLGRPRESDGALDPRVEEDAVQVGVVAYDALF